MKYTQTYTIFYADAIDESEIEIVFSTGRQFI